MSIFVYLNIKSFKSIPHFSAISKRSSIFIPSKSESFKELLKVKGLAKKLGLLKCNVSIWKGISEGKHPNKKLPSKEMMEKILNQYGAKKVKEEEWTFLICD